MNLGTLISGDLKERDSWRVEGCFGGETQGPRTGLEGLQEGGGLSPAVSCAVSEWSGWSRCVKPCQASYHVCRRRVLQKLRNGGVPCPPLEEQVGCVEYWSHQGVECQQSLIPTLITRGSYGKEQEKQDIPKKQATAGTRCCCGEQPATPGAEGPGRN
ncbi:somatomedin-B and thrombospondin type-1 domain-containing protein-like [Cebus imitator]|uniref:somatomedin-B and thrombospondin type-1 domain-containing protein-like n=1 Tax=Cebus imitator TaxID=2715852 RepID=UPI0018971FA5|nr:somatomedin-B and thrombospondin type-1 domain-containing protein-like [Cebus imitator]